MIDFGNDDESNENSRDGEHRDENEREPFQTGERLEPNAGDGSQFLLLMVAVYLCLILVSLLIGRFGFADLDQPLTLEFFKGTWGLSLSIGLLTTIPLTLAMLIPIHYRWSEFDEMREAVATHMRPWFLRLSTGEILFACILVGLGEELLFRWVLQGWLSNLVEGPVGLALSLFVASVLFGICHWVNATYAIVTTLVGFLLGVEMILAGSWVAPAITHALYDFIAICYLVDRLPWKFSKKDSAP